MNAVKLYVSTARLVLENEQFDYKLCKLISHSFANLELSLMCTVCRGLLSDPHSPVDSACQHHVCQRCLCGHKKLKPSCSWCKDWTKYVRNTQLQCLLSCYRGLCQYVKCTNLMADPNSLPEQEKRVVLGVLNRGAELGFDPNAASRDPKLTIGGIYSMMSSFRNDDLCRYRRVFNANAVLTSDHHEDFSAANSSDECGAAMDVSKVKAERRRRLSEHLAAGTEKLLRGEQTQVETHALRCINSSEESAASDAESQPLYSVAFAGTRSKLILKRRKVLAPKCKTSHSKDEDGDQQLPAVSYALRAPNYIKNHHHLKMERNSRGRFIKSELKQNRPVCRCGIGASQSGKLACCGQRCACYMQKMACSSCRCRGCRNPHLMDGVKILGEFLKGKEQGESKIIGNTPSSYLNNESTNCISQVVHTSPTNSSAVIDIS